MPDNETALDYLESQIPALAESAINVAYWKTLASGQSVMESDDGAIYEVFPDGTRRFVKQIERPTPVQRGQKILIR